MSLSGKNVSTLEESHSTLSERFAALRQNVVKLFSAGEQRSLVATFVTTLTVFGIFLIQGIIVARMLGPVGRGEFGTSLYFPRDIFLYAGLLGAVEIVAGYAARGHRDLGQLRYSAFRLGLLTGILTASVAAIVLTVVLIAIGKAYIIPFGILVCLFVPFEHIHLTVSSVDRGNKQYARYNFNRLVFAMVFPIAVLLAWQFQVAELTGISQLALVCLLFVFSRVLGLLPTMIGWKFLSNFGHAANSKPETTPGNWQLLKEGKPYALSMLVSEAFDRLDIFLILALADVATSGQYFVAVPAAALLIVAPNSLGVFTFNAGANKKFVPSLKQTWLAIGLTSLLQVLATAVMLVAIPFLIVAVFGDAYRPAIQFAMWLLPACAIKGFIQAADAYLKGREKPMIGVWSRGISIVLMLVVVWLFYDSWGLLSIPMSACVGQAFSAIVIVTAVLLDINERNQDLKRNPVEVIE